MLKKNNFKVQVFINLPSYRKIRRSHWGGDITGNVDVENDSQQHSATFFDAHFRRGKCPLVMDF